MPQPLFADRYLLQTRLGAGGFGEVWAATDTATGREVAVKILRRGAEASAEQRHRFAREVRVIRALEHPGLVRVFDVLEGGDGAPAYVMERLVGQTFRERLAPKKPLELPAVLEILLPAMDAVQAVHDANIVHRDLKPENIFIDESAVRPRVQVLDFGLAKLMPESALGGGTALTSAEAVLGTPAYMAPEQVTASMAVDHRADIWSFGVMLYEALTGGLPIEGESNAHMLRGILTSAIVPLELLAPGLPPRVTRLVTRMLARDAEERADSLEAIRQVLADFAS